MVEHYQKSVPSEKAGCSFTIKVLNIKIYLAWPNMTPEITESMLKSWFGFDYSLLPSGRLLAFLVYELTGQSSQPTPIQPQQYQQPAPNSNTNQFENKYSSSSSSFA